MGACNTLACPAHLYVHFYTQANPIVWQLSICYFGIGIVRSFFGDWGAVFVTEKYKADGMSDDEIDGIVAKCISCLEMVRSQLF